MVPIKNQYQYFTSIPINTSDNHSTKKNPKAIKVSAVCTSSPSTAWSWPAPTCWPIRWANGAVPLGVSLNNGKDTGMAEKSVVKWEMSLISPSKMMASPKKLVIEPLEIKISMAKLEI